MARFENQNNWVRRLEGNGPSNVVVPRLSGPGKLSFKLTLEEFGKAEAGELKSWIIRGPVSAHVGDRLIFKEWDRSKGFTTGRILGGTVSEVARTGEGEPSSTIRTEFGWNLDGEGVKQWHAGIRDEGARAPVFGGSDDAS